jgi:hypothetical protein
VHRAGISPPWSNDGEESVSVTYDQRCCAIQPRNQSPTFDVPGSRMTNHESST